jgi:hypothetical protein
MFLPASVAIAVGLLQVDTATGLYPALVQASYHGTPGSEMVITDTAVEMPTLRGSSSVWLKQFNAVPSELRRAASEPSPTESRRFDSSLFPTGTRLVPAAKVQKIFRNRGIEENWSAFRTEFKAEGWLAFSAALLGEDQLNALVYYESRCGGLCGEGGYVWLRRDTTGSPWQIVKKIISWMS